MIVSACAAELGAVKVADRVPLCRTALPAITAYTWSPSARARSRVVSSRTAPPSPSPAPSASASKARDRALGDMISGYRARESVGGWVVFTLRPPASA